MASIAEHGVGIRCVIGNEAAKERVPSNSSVCIDPPYGGTTGYAYSFDVTQLAGELRCSIKAPFLASEGCLLSKEARRLAFGSAKGGISGTKSTKRQERLNLL